MDTLRYYDKIGLLKPALIKENGYRYYSPRQLDTLDFILIGKSLDIPLASLADQLKSGSLKDYKQLLEKQQAVILKQKEELERLNKETANLLTVIADMDHLEESNETKKETLDLKIYATHTDSIFKYRNPFTESIEPLTFNQWSIFSKKGKELTISDFGVSLKNKDMTINHDQIIYLKGTFVYHQFIGTHEEIAEYCQSFKEKESVNKLFIRYNLTVPSFEITDSKHYITIYYQY